MTEAAIKVKRACPWDVSKSFLTFNLLNGSDNCQVPLFFPSVESIVQRLEENELMTNSNKSNNRSKVEISN